jgi:16S rRNA (cytosine1402-N4)-methyltransferase
MILKAKNIAKLHKSVLAREVLEAFGLGEAPLKSKVKIIDATLGLAGHTLKLVQKEADVLGLDTDPEMLKLAKKRLESALARPIPEFKKTQGSFKLVLGNFRNIEQLAQKEGFVKVQGILFDLGVSSPQLTSKKRGFSFQNDKAKLDMRFDPHTQSLKASDLLNVLRKDQLTSLFSKILDKNTSQKLSEKIVELRSTKRFESVADVNKVIKGVVNKKKNINVSTLPFLALRIAVNSELENLKEGLVHSIKLLDSGGKLVVISFHSTEDNVVTDLFNDFNQKNFGKILTKKPILPTSKEVSKNPRSRSAKLRIFEKI